MVSHIHEKDEAFRCLGYITTQLATIHFMLMLLVMPFRVNISILNTLQVSIYYYYFFTNSTKSNVQVISFLW